MSDANEKGRQIRTDKRIPNLTLATAYGEPGAEVRRELVASLWTLLDEASLLRDMLQENRPGADMVNTATGMAERARLIGEAVKVNVTDSRLW